jgi:hypothetical protein|tara:strand:- start:40 stop:267 length:228 start_codon:yes stop_codon:yes gene_type:complete
MKEIKPLLDRGIKDDITFLKEKGKIRMIYVKSKKDYEDKEIIFNGKLYFLVKHKEILGKSKKLEDLIPNSVVNQL